MKGVIYVRTIFNTNVLISDPMEWDELTETLKVLLKPSVYGNRDKFTISVDFITK